MRREEIRVALLYIEGTNNDQEVHVALRRLGSRPELVHLKQLTGEAVAPAERRRLEDFQMLLVPGGFSAGDYVRAGAIFAARIRSTIGPALIGFIRAGGLVGGICNGFQVLTELGLLPGAADGGLGTPTAILAPNDSGRYECRPTYVRWEGGRFAPFGAWPPGTVLYAPSGHGEGKLVLSGVPAKAARRLAEDGQVLFRWVDPAGERAGYPWNPNGSAEDIAGLTNREGNVFGLMPHPERAFLKMHAPDWTRRRAPPDAPGDGHRFYDALLSYLERHG